MSPEPQVQVEKITPPMTPEEIKELEDLKKACLKADGNPRKDAKPELVERLNQLQAKYDEEHTMKLPDNAKIEGGIRGYTTLNVLGRKIEKPIRDIRP
jgi:hypothetical protein